MHRGGKAPATAAVASIVPLLCVAIVVASVALPAPLASQAAAFRLAAPDSLTYREISRATFEIRVPQESADFPAFEVEPGTQTFRTLQNAVIVLRGSIPGAARAWYRSLSLRQDGPGDEARELPTAPMLHAPFDLHIASTGRIELVRAPSVPDDISGVNDLALQFHDFFITLPSVPLTPGTRWSDTTISTRSPGPETSYREELIRHYEVVGDTMVQGAGARLVRVHSTVAIEGRFTGRELSASSILAGADTGWAAFSVPDGRMVARAKRGSLHGTYAIAAGGRSVAAPVTQRHEITIHLQ